jgi:hypothetical protein
MLLTAKHEDLDPALCTRTLPAVLACGQYHRRRQKKEMIADKSDTHRDACR